MKQNKINSVKSIAKVIATNSISPILFEDEDAAYENLLNLKSDLDITNACIMNTDNEVFASYTQLKATKVDFKKIMLHKGKRDTESKNIYFCYPIKEQNEYLGMVCVKASLENLYAQLFQKIRLTFLIILIGIIISFIFASIFQKYISLPILKLVTLMEKVSETKNFAYRSEVNSRDEIGKLALEFNELLAQIQKHDDTLLEANILLESKVKERTKELEIKNEKLVIAKSQAEKSKQVKEQFLASMSHEIRTPLNAIIGFQELLKSTKLNLEQREYVNSIDFAGRNLLVIINDILDISKIESGKFIFEEIEINILETLKSVIELVEFRAIEKQIKVNYQIENSFPEEVLGDGTRLIQILLNLIGNAIKFTEKGEINIFVKTLNEDENILMAEFKVQDSGIGISPENIKTIFERFTQASSETNRKYGGTGLGLTIVQQLVELQGGKISVESKLNVGSIFTFTIPFHKFTGSRKPSHISINQDKELLENLEILLVEDMHLNQSLVKKIMQKWDYKLVIVNNGVEALEILKTQTFDLILMDIQMPIMDGYVTTQEIRNSTNELINKIPIIALTAHASSSEAEKCINLGMNAYLAKPFKADVLKKLIHQFVQERKIKDNMKHYDLSYLIEHADGDQDFLKDMIHTFLVETPLLIQELKDSIDEKDFEKIKINSHSAKGLFLTLGIHQAGYLIKEIEKLAEKGEDLELIIQKYSEIEKIYLESKTYLEEELTQI
ncbi:MAG: ATP-binding protein [Bacteroidota bacterium]